MIISFMIKRLDAFAEMICAESQFFRINRILLYVLGLWPYKQSKFTRLQSVLYYTILTSFIAVQVCGINISYIYMTFYNKIFYNILTAIFSYNFVIYHNLKIYI